MTGRKSKRSRKKKRVPQETGGCRGGPKKPRISTNEYRGALMRMKHNILNSDLYDQSQSWRNFYTQLQNIRSLSLPKTIKKRDIETLEKIAGRVFKDGKIDKGELRRAIRASEKSNNVLVRDVLTQFDKLYHDYRMYNFGGPINIINRIRGKDKEEKIEVYEKKIVDTDELQSNIESGAAVFGGMIKSVNGNLWAAKNKFTMFAEIICLTLASKNEFAPLKRIRVYTKDITDFIREAYPNSGITPIDQRSNEIRHILKKDKGFTYFSIIKNSKSGYLIDFQILNDKINKAIIQVYRNAGTSISDDIKPTTPFFNHDGLFTYYTSLGYNVRSLSNIFNFEYETPDDPSTPVVRIWVSFSIAGMIRGFIKKKRILKLFTIRYKYRSANIAQQAQQAKIKEISENDKSYIIGIENEIRDYILNNQITQNIRKITEGQFKDALDDVKYTLCQIANAVMESVDTNDTDGYAQAINRRNQLIGDPEECNRLFREMSAELLKEQLGAGQNKEISMPKGFEDPDRYMMTSQKGYTENEKRFFISRLMIFAVALDKTFSPTKELTVSWNTNPVTKQLDIDIRKVSSIIRYMRESYMSLDDGKLDEAYTLSLQIQNHLLNEDPTSYMRFMEKISEIYTYTLGRLKVKERFQQNITNSKLPPRDQVVAMFLFNLMYKQMKEDGQTNLSRIFNAFKREYDQDITTAQIQGQEVFVTDIPDSVKDFTTSLRRNFPKDKPTLQAMLKDSNIPNDNDELVINLLKNLDRIKSTFQNKPYQSVKDKVNLQRSVKFLLLETGFPSLVTYKPT